MNSRPRRPFLALTTVALLGLLAVASASAQITFTITGTITNTSFGFTANDPVTFTYTLVQNPSPAFSGTAALNSFYQWRDEDIGADTELWSNVTGSPFSGTWSRPSVSSSSPTSMIQVQQTTTINLHAGSSNYTDPTGLTFGPGNVTYIYTTAQFVGLSFDVSSGSLPDANTYFAALAGTYSANTDFGSFFSLDAGDVDFTATSLTISAIPEPSTYAALAGLGALGLAMLRRRRAA